MKEGLGAGREGDDGVRPGGEACCVPSSRATRCIVYHCGSVGPASASWPPRDRRVGDGFGESPACGMQGWVTISPVSSDRMLSLSKESDGAARRACHVRDIGVCPPALCGLGRRAGRGEALGELRGLPLPKEALALSGPPRWAGRRRGPAGVGGPAGAPREPPAAAHGGGEKALRWPKGPGDRAGSRGLRSGLELCPALRGG